MLIKAEEIREIHDKLERWDLDFGNTTGFILDFDVERKDGRLHVEAIVREIKK